MRHYLDRRDRARASADTSAKGHRDADAQRILVVEDEPAIAELISVNLRHAGLPDSRADGNAAQREL